MVDVLRIIASLQMINGHTLDALLTPAWESGPTFVRYTWYRGLVSVAFLLVAGMAYYLATLRRFDAHKSNPEAVRRRFRRGIDLVLIGYALRIPWNLFGPDPELAARQWSWLITCGVLQCIGITLIMLEAMTWFAKKPSQVVGGAIALATLLFAAAPWLDTLQFEGSSRILMNYLSHQGGSPFPVAPWGAYMLGGVAIGAFVLPQGSDTPLWSRLLRLGMLGGASYLAYQSLKGNPVPFQTADTTYSARPIAAFDRLRGITALLAGLAVLCHPIRRLPRVFAIVSGETLAVYVIHLVLLFQPPFNLAWRLGLAQYELEQALLVSLAMIVTTIALTLLWHEQKKRGWLRSVRRWFVERLLGSEDRDARVVK
ncbi:MAG: heparan-alpha-glucosaminide N-acetyltransferase domain-containing protein [Myxococcota bacterium]